MQVLTTNAIIKQLRIDKGFTIREIAQKIDIPFNTYAGYEYNPQRRMPIDVLNKLSIVFETTVDYLKHGSKKIDEQGNPVVIYVDRDTKLERVAYVPVAAQAGYLKNYTDIGYLEKLDTYSIPGFSNGTFRMFPVQGNSMVPTYYPNDILICEPVENYKYMQDGSCYVIVSTEGICIKRCINAVDKRKVIIIESDNVEYKPDIISIESVIEIWSPKARITAK